MRLKVLLNPTAGALFTRRAGIDVPRVRDEFRSAGAEADVELVEAAALQSAVQAACDGSFDAVVIGGGDGSVSSAAAVMVRQPTPLAVLPLGTFNHFARDLHVPFHLHEAVRAIVYDGARTIDVAEVNDTIFLNNSCVGAYADLVDDRELYRHRDHIPKWRAGVYAFARVFSKPPIMQLRLSAGDRATSVLTSFLLVGNNRYDTGVFGFGRRPRLDGGVLCVYAAHGQRRRDAVRSVGRVMLGHPETDSLFQAASLPEITVEPDVSDVKVTLDGELRRLTPPLVYLTRPNDLKVIAPQDSP